MGATTLFATHYHDLTEIADAYERVRNVHFAAERDEGAAGADGAVTFLHRVADGPASSSYGVEVAQLAGVPNPVVERARTLVSDESDGAATNGHDERVQVTLDGVSAECGAGDHEDVVDTLRDADLATTTPIEALTLLANLQDRVSE